MHACSKTCPAAAPAQVTLLLTFLARLGLYKTSFYDRGATDFLSHAGTRTPFYARFHKIANVLPGQDIPSSSAPDD